MEKEVQFVKDVPMMYIKLIITVTVVSEKDLSVYYSVCLYK